MFRRTDPQRSLFNAFDTLSEQQQTRMKGNWAFAFRHHGLPLINEESFAGIYHNRMGAPNKSIRLMIGTLILKDVFDLTDEETLDALLFDARWHVALDLDPREAQLCQKTLHNFRVALMEFELGPVLFEQTTTDILQALDLDTGRQRMDSTHISAHVARLTRLGTCCETIRLFLRDLKQQHPASFAEVPESLKGRYLKRDGSATKYDDATREEARKRLPVGARDVYRLHEQFASHESITALESYALLTRCLKEQCEIVEEPQTPRENDKDAGEEPVPVRPLDKKQLCGSTFSTPHDPQVTFGAKGLGYEVQIVETFGNKAVDVAAGDGRPVRPELITYVTVTDSCSSDVHETLPALADLARRGIRPRELEVDSNFTSSEVVLKAEQQGTDVNGPVKGGDKYLPDPNDVTLAEFTIDLDDASQTRCPQGHAPRNQSYDPETGKLQVLFDQASCAGCPLIDRCPTVPVSRPNSLAGCRELRTTMEDICMEERRRYQTTSEFHERYANRAGIEATNSEIKRGHGMGRLRVRGRPRVNLAVFLKTVACNFKRFIQYRLAEALQPRAEPVVAHG
jgi:DDE family transposase/transposase-like protein DUF772